MADRPLELAVHGSMRASHGVPLPTPDQTPAHVPAEPRDLPGLPLDEPIPPEMSPEQESPVTPLPDDPLGPIR